MKNERKYYLFTDDGQEAFRLVQKKKREDPKGKYGFAEVRFMLNPPKTVHKFAVFKII